MRNLKTFQDIRNSCTDNDAVVDSLKEEAIKWIKAIKKAIREKDKGWNILRIDDVDIMCGEYYCDNVEKWIKHFFNISEEDLNEK